MLQRSVLEKWHMREWLTWLTNGDMCVTQMSVCVHDSRWRSGWRTEIRKHETEMRRWQTDSVQERWHLLSCLIVVLKWIACNRHSRGLHFFFSPLWHKYFFSSSWLPHSNPGSSRVSGILKVQQLWLCQGLRKQSESDTARKRNIFSVGGAGAGSPHIPVVNAICAGAAGSALSSSSTSSSSAPAATSHPAAKEQIFDRFGAWLFHNLQHSGNAWKWAACGATVCSRGRMYWL